MASDGLPARSVGNWSNEKLFYLRRYCEIFNRGMQYHWSTRVYIDLFAGPGRCVIRGTGEEIDGSPVIAASCMPGFSHLFVNDLDPEAIGSLLSRLHGRTAAEVYDLNQDCNAAAMSISRDLDRLSPSSQLSVCFIDPTNWQIHFESVAALAQGRRMDLIVVFQIGQMKRALRSKSLDISLFFGDDLADPEWYRLYEQNGLRARGLTRIFLDHYRRRLDGLGYAEYHDEVSVEYNNDGVPLYHMLFASKHSRGTDFWRKISGRQHDGQMRLL